MGPQLHYLNTVGSHHRAWLQPEPRVVFEQDWGRRPHAIIRISRPGQPTHRLKGPYYDACFVWADPAGTCGLPATAAPIGHSPSGLPIGVQFVGPYLEDRTTIAFAELLERQFGGFVPPPGYA
jgi:amidase